MGCDIHAYIEFYRHDRWHSFGERINPGRNYSMFGLMAGARSNNLPLFSIRGIPSDISIDVEFDYYKYISNNLSDNYGRSEDGELSLISLEQALKLEKTYGCKIIKRSDGTPDKIANVDWHSASWLNLYEFEKIITTYNQNFKNGSLYLKLDVRYEAILAAMKTIENDNLCRLVFWFDN